MPKLKSIAPESAISPLVAPTPWVSWRTYRTPDKECRTLLLNQSTGEFLLLEGGAAEYWELLCGQPTTWEELSQPLGISTADVVDFASELAAAGLIKSASREPVACFTESSIPEDVEISKDLEREMMAWTAKNGFIYSAHWEVTYRCNEICVHCYNPGAAHTPDEKPQRETAELSTEESKSMLRQLVDLGVFRLTLSGGEATLRKDFLDILAYARSLGFQVVIYTNGLKIQKNLINKISQLYPASVEVSIYSAEPDQHDAVTRVPGSFEKTMQSLALFRE